MKPLVAGSLGNYGAYLADGSEYHGNYKVSDDVIYEYHSSRLELLPTVDILLFETIPSQ